MEKHIILALSLLAIAVPTMVLAAPTLLDQLMDVNAADADQDQAFANAVQNLNKREVDRFHDSEDNDYSVMAQHIRSRRSSKTMNQCMFDCWLCIQVLTRNAIKLGDCVAGCSGMPTRKMLTNPLDAQSWSTCRSNFVQS